MKKFGVVVFTLVLIAITVLGPQNVWGFNPNARVSKKVESVQFLSDEDIFSNMAIGLLGNDEGGFFTDAVFLMWASILSNVEYTPVYLGPRVPTLSWKRALSVVESGELGSKKKVFHVEPTLFPALCRFEMVIVSGFSFAEWRHIPTLLRPGAEMACAKPIHFILTVEDANFMNLEAPVLSLLLRKQISFVALGRAGKAAVEAKIKEAIAAYPVHAAWLGRLVVEDLFPVPRLSCDTKAVRKSISADVPVMGFKHPSALKFVVDSVKSVRIANLARLQASTNRPLSASSLPPPLEVLAESAGIKDALERFGMKRGHSAGADVRTIRETGGMDVFHTLCSGKLILPASLVAPQAESRLPSVEVYLAIATGRPLLARSDAIAANYAWLGDDSFKVIDADGDVGTAVTNAIDSAMNGMQASATGNFILRKLLDQAQQDGRAMISRLAIRGMRDFRHRKVRKEKMGFHALRQHKLLEGNVSVTYPAPPTSADPMTIVVSYAGWEEIELSLSLESLVQHIAPPSRVYVLVPARATAVEVCNALPSAAKRFRARGGVRPDQRLPECPDDYGVGGRFRGCVCPSTQIAVLFPGDGAPAPGPELQIKFFGEKLNLTLNADREFYCRCYRLAVQTRHLVADSLITELPDVLLNLNAPRALVVSSSSIVQDDVVKLWRHPVPAGGHIGIPIGDQEDGELGSFLSFSSTFVKSHFDLKQPKWHFNMMVLDVKGLQEAGADELIGKTQQAQQTAVYWPSTTPAHVVIPLALHEHLYILPERWGVGDTTWELHPRKKIALRQDMRTKKHDLSALKALQDAHAIDWEGPCVADRCQHLTNLFFKGLVHRYVPKASQNFKSRCIAETGLTKAWTTATRE
mmetsp:Transcript_6053/g.17110  ORF Transcript_6053/g.17110 Transcript_6053/m.17110 type:complete len:864 (+) Transcript_6053:95-2686(+)